MLKPWLRRIAAPAPAQTAERLAALFTDSLDAIICTDVAGNITDWNKAAHAMFGHAADEAVGSHVSMVIGDVRPPEQAGLAEGASGADSRQLEALGRAKAGYLIDLALTVSPMRNAGGDIIGTAYIARDVTARRRADARLRKNEARLRFALEAADIGSWRWEVDTGEMQRSAAHDRCFGHATPLPEWSLEAFQQQLHPDDRDDVMLRVRKAIQAEGEFRAECRVIWPDESVHWIVIYGTMAHRIDAVRSMTGIIVDITRRKQSEAARANAVMLEAENRRILDASRAKNIFLANMSHELRTPLNAIIGFSDVLASGMLPADSPRYAAFLAHIQTSSRHLLQLINDVLDLSKVEAGKFTFDPESIDLEALVRDVVDVLHTQIVRKRLHIDIEIAPDLQDIFLDPSRLKQILFNYLSNAIKFTPEGGAITIKARPEGATHLRIEVQDTGVGIAPQDLDRLFVEFSQIDNALTGSHEGTGLGLALARRLAEAQGGRVGACSVVGVGSVFSLVLNRKHGTDIASLSQASSSPNDGSAPRLLVVHDSAAERASFAHAVRETGVAMEWAASSEQALEHMRERRFDAMALQLMLPDRQGLPLLADIRRRQWAGDMPVIGLMVHDGGGRTASFAITDVLAKPVRAPQVLAMLQGARLAASGSRKVLVIDDEPESLDLMETILLQGGMTAICRTDGGDALADIENHQPDAIILSLMMSGMNGLDVLARIDQLPEYRHIPVFICTSMALSDADYETLRHSASTILNRGRGMPGPAISRMAHSLRQRAALSKAGVS